MKTILQGDQTYATRALGDPCPYLVQQPSGVALCSDFSEAVEHIPIEERFLDPVALISLLQHGYVCGDRTLLRGLTRLPFHAVVDAQGNIESRPQFEHGVCRDEPAHIARRLLDLLVQAVERDVRTESRVFLLLSGGLDSRAIAGALSQIQSACQFSVSALTWGLTCSRDWDYAQRICELYGWEHVNIPLDPSATWANIARSVHYQGAEVSGIHLHGLPDLAEHIPPNSVILSGIYGDSIGRGAYQGVNILRLRRPAPTNRWQLVPRPVYRRHRAEFARDLVAPLSRGKCHTAQQTYELGMVENYMRRHINQVMSYLCRDYRLSLPFADEQVVRYMWSLDPTLRDDRVYLYLIPMLDRDLARIPWQKTNRPLLSDASEPAGADLAKDFHHYSQWVQTELRDRFAEVLNSDALRQIPFLNHQRVQRMWVLYQQDRFSRYPKLADRVARLFARLAGVAMLIDTYHLHADASPQPRHWLDRSRFYTDVLCALENAKSEAKERLRYARFRAKNER